MRTYIYQNKTRIIIIMSIAAYREKENDLAAPH
jgi:hypothetical protein